MRLLAFRGRGRPREYWALLLFLITFVIVASDLNSRFAAFMPVSKLLSWAVLIPTATIGIRRLHDAGWRGWWMLVPGACLGILIWLVPSAEAEADPDPFTPLRLMVVTSGLVMVVSLTLYGVLPTQRGHNRFGRDPRTRAVDLENVFR